MTSDPSDLGGLVAALVVITVSSLLVAAAVYVWTGLAMSKLFGRLSVEPWRGWVPLLNVAEVLALGGSPRWIALLFLVPFANIYALVMFAIAAHRVNALFGRGAGMTVLAVLVLPVWATVLAWGKNTPDPERGRLASVLGRQAQPTGPLAVPPQPVAPRSETPGPETSRSEAPAGERAFPPLPGLENQVPVRPGARTPTAERPAPVSSAPVPPPPTVIAPPPGTTAGWPASPPAAQQPAAFAPPTAFAQPGSAQAGVEPAASHPGASGPADPTGGAQPALPQHPPTGDAVPAPTAPATPAAPSHPTPPAVFTPAAPWAPGPDLTTPQPPAPTGAPVQPAAGTPAHPAAPAAPAAEAFDHRVATDDEHGGLDFADAATIVAYADDPGDVEATVVVDRRPRREWRLELDDGEVLRLTDEVVVLGRNPSASAGEQRLPVPDRTRTLSKTHARLAHRNGVWTITDLGSTNGVLIVDAAGEETLIEPDVETTVTGRFVLGEVGMRVTEAGS